NLQTGDPVFQGDSIETGADGSLVLLFCDGTIFELSESAHLALDDFKYEPNDGSNLALFRIVRGAFSFINGDTRPNRNFWVDTPMARIRAGLQRYGTGAVTFAALTFAVIEKLQA